jgi:hypothetical protein
VLDVVRAAHQVAIVSEGNADTRRIHVTEDLRLWTILMLSAGALFVGGLVWYAWERVWIWRRLDIRAFALDFRRSVRRADPAMPILLVICGNAAGVFASLTGGGSRTLALAGIGLLATILIGSIVIAEPINSRFPPASRGPGTAAGGATPAALAILSPGPHRPGRRRARVSHHCRHLRKLGLRVMPSDLRERDGVDPTPASP